MQIVLAAFAAIVATCFAPEGNCALVSIGAIDAAQHEIFVNAYALTTVSGIPGALIRAHERGAVHRSLLKPARKVGA
jgi:hypothetical protein